MSAMSNHEYTKRDAFASIAFWQFMAFILLICVIWVNEHFDLAFLILGAQQSEFNSERGAILTAAAIVGAIVTVGHTYERQRRLVKQLMTSCTYCHRVKTEKGQWMHVEDYFMENFPMAVDKQACPDCRQMLDAADSTAST